jgi:hypothetical protein
MADIIKFENSTIFTGVTSTEHFLITRMHEKQVGIPVYKFSSSNPDIDLFELKKSEFILDNATFYNSATSYGVGVAFSVNNEKFAFPIYKVKTNDDNFIDLKLFEPTVVSNVNTLSAFAAINIDNEYYGIPLYSYSGLFTGDQNSPASAFKINTTFLTNFVSDITPEAGSTYLNNKIRTYSLLINRIKRNLGWPNINVNICDENIVDYIDQSLEYYTKYTGYTEEYLMFTTLLYKRGCGIKLDDLFSVTPEMASTCYSNASASYDYDLGEHRKVIDVFSFEQGEGVGINTLFTLEQAMVQQTYYGYMLGNTGFDLVTWEVLKGWLDTRKKVLAQVPHIRFDPRTQIMKILPEPYSNQAYTGVVGCYVERRIDELISEPWVIEYTLALTSIALGRIYGKFTGMTLPIGGGSINYGDLQQYGLKRKEELEKELYTGLGFADTPPPVFFVG